MIGQVVREGADGLAGTRRTVALERFFALDQVRFEVGEHLSQFLVCAGSHSARR